MKRIESLDDMLALPPEEIEDFVIQLRAWLLMHASNHVEGRPHVPAAYDPRFIAYLPGSSGAAMEVPAFLRLVE